MLTIAFSGPHMVALGICNTEGFGQFLITTVVCQRRLRHDVIFSDYTRVKAVLFSASVTWRDSFAPEWRRSEGLSPPTKTVTSGLFWVLNLKK